MQKVKLEKEQMYTLKEISEYAEISISMVRLVIKKLGIEAQKLNILTGGKTCDVNFYSSEDTDKVLKDVEETQKAKEEARLKKVVKEEVKYLDIEKLKKEHPLVQNVRCFDLDWWPEPLPYLEDF